MTTFIQWWESDERFALAHEDEATQARAAWNAAVRAAMDTVVQRDGVGVASDAIAALLCE